MGPLTERTHSTADVRDIADVLADLRVLIAGKLPGNRGTSATWAAIGEAGRIITEDRAMLREPDVPEWLQWSRRGEIYAASAIIRRVADAWGVPNETRLAETEVQT